MTKTATVKLTIESEQVELSRLKLVTDPSHILYDERAKEKPDPALIASLEDNGQEQNILVADTPDGLLIVGGRRRYKAAEALGWETISAKIIKVENDSQLLELMIGENLRKEKTLVQKSRELARYYDILDKENLEHSTDEALATPLTEKFKQDRAQRTFGVSKDVRRNLELLAFYCSGKVLKAASPRGVVGPLISESVAIEIARLYPDNHDKQDAHLAKLLNKGKGKVSQKTVKPLGERPFKTAEIIELADYVDVPKNFREVLYFIAGKPQDKEGTLKKYGWLRDIVEGDSVDNGVGDDDDDGDEEYGESEE